MLLMFNAPNSISAVVLCPILTPPANGTVLVNGRRVNDTAVYMCDPGFERNGPLVRRCMPNGEWSDEAPTCDADSKHHFHPCMQYILGFFKPVDPRTFT